MKIYRGLKSVCTAMETNPLIFSPIYCKLQTMTQFLIYVAAVLQWSADNAADHIHTEPLHSAARPSEISADKSPPRGEPPVWLVVLQTKEGKDFTIMKMAPTRAFSWLKDTMLNGHLNMVSRCEIGRWRKHQN